MAISSGPELSDYRLIDKTGEGAWAWSGEATADITDYIENFYNRRRRPSHLGDISPVEYESYLIQT